LFSGDLGRQNDPILHPPDKMKNADILFVESTYGNRDCAIDSVKPQLAQAINDALHRHGCILIPAFSVGRTQNMLMYIKDLMTEKLIPEVEVFMDSPMAIAATEIYRNHTADHKLTEEMMRDDDSFLTLNRNLIVVQSREASIYLNNKKERAIIISASGMMTGGRILHHLYNRLPRKNDTLLVVGYQAEGTRGRRLVNREKTIRIFGQDVPVNCHVEQIDGLSAHADACELFDWLRHFENSPKMTFVVHGEQESATYMAAKIESTLGWNAFVPQYLESFELFQGI
jgi:metallo-beta-lactamase family protein